MAKNITVKNEKKLKTYLRKIAKQDKNNDTQSNHKTNKGNKSGSSAT